MSRPLHHEDVCGECFGEAGAFQWDWDGEEQQRVWVECEACANCGRVTSCDRCDAAMPLTVAETTGYLCAGCVAAGDRADQADDYLRVARRAS